MKLLIDIPEEKFNNFMCGDSLDDKDYDEIVDFIAQGTPIPDNATNGDVINTLFSDIGIIQTDPYTGIIEIDLDWWNAQYKEVSKA